MPTTYAIPNGATAFAATTYTGNGGTQPVMNAVNSVGFQPDLVWIKSRSNAYNNLLNDSVRGVGQSLVSNDTGAELNYTAYFTAFSANGFSLAGGSNAFNSSSVTYVGWQWKAGGTSVSNTSGSITSQISANTTAGFSVVTWTGTGSVGTIGHGLGSAPKFIISKSRSTAGTNWNTYSPTGVTNIVYLNSAVATSSQPNVWNSTAPTSSVFTVGTDNDSNGSGRTMVAYCWAEVAGYSAFGSYTGNGSTDGVFVYTGFRPRWLLIKRTNTTESWVLVDSSRDPYNVVSKYMLINTSDAEADGVSYDFVSNGIKFRGTSQNQSGATYIYATFAENPFKYANAR